MLGFGIMIIMGVNLDAIRIRDVAMEITHNGSYTRA
jgi:hypothetical protein